jgi:hypothetical protein
MPPSASRATRAAIAAFVLLAGATAGAADPPRVYVTQRTATPPRIDGHLDEAVWDAVEWTDGFIQREPAEGAPPTGDTRFKVLYDDDNLYLAYHALDPDPDGIVSILDRRDNFPGDWVEVNIDSYHDHRTAFSFTASLSGSQGDEFISEDGENWDGNWDPVWEHQARPTGDGWAAEVRIPLSQLRYGDRDEHVWGIQVQRRIYRQEERSVWQPIPKDEAGWVSRFGELRGIRGIRPQRRVELLPYTVAKGESFKEVPGDPFSDGNDRDLSGGLDGKIGITTDLTLDLTVNPDFGQVEADPSEVNLSAFETFFDEKRPFFIEGANIFEYRLAPSVAFGTHTTDRLFYSRRVGRPPSYRADFNEAGYVDQPENTSIQGAAKLTGKTKNGTSIGILDALTAKEEARVDAGGARSDVTVEPASNFFVGRVQRDFDRGDTRLGAMVTAVNRRIDDSEVDFLHRSAYTGGLDFFHYVGERDYYLAVNVVGSRVAGSQEAVLDTQTSSARYFQRPDNEGQSVDSTRTSLAGHGGSVRLGKSQGRLNFDGGVAWRSPGLELNDLGFMRNSDEINQFGWMGYSLRNPFGIFRRMALNVNQWLDFEYGGRNTYQAFNFNTNAAFRNNWNYYYAVTRQNERTSLSELRGGPAMKVPGDVGMDGEIGTDSRRRLSGGFGGSRGFTDDDAGRSSGLWSWISWRPTNAVRLQLNPGYRHNQPELQYVQESAFDAAHPAAGQPAFVYGSLDQKTFDLSLRLDYSLTPTLTVQFYGAPFVSAGEYRDFKRITDPLADAYGDRFVPLDGVVARDPSTGRWTADEDADGSPDSEVRDRDFNVRDFNSNLVVRWEYSPGSSLYLVWSQSRSAFEPDGRFSVRDDLDGLFDVHPHDVFLIKINRWIDL